MLYHNKWLHGVRSSSEPRVSKLDNTTLASVYNHQDIIPERLSIVREMTRLRGVDALKDYCNSPAEKTTGQEGLTNACILINLHPAGTECH